jgi:hypothetical protein
VDGEEFGREWEALLARLRGPAEAPPAWAHSAAAGVLAERLAPGMAERAAYGPVLVGPDAGDEKGG